jgi:toxin-antitoxin system PIN domain toxin
VSVVDTNLLIYAAIRESPQHDRAHRLVVEWGRSAESWRITWSIAYEFLRVVTHRSALLHPLSFTVAWGFIERLRLSPSFGFLVETDRHAEVVRDLALEYPRTSGNRMHDLHITALMRENGVVELRTADVGFHEFNFLRVVNPL